MPSDVAEASVELKDVASSEHDSESGSDDDQTSDRSTPPVASLVETREKRKGAGNRMAALLQNEDPDEELDTIFMEDEAADFEFVNPDDIEHDDDDASSSSSDEETQAANDPLDGEAKLQKEEQAQRTARKRKLAAHAFVKPSAPRKRLKLDGSNQQSDLHPDVERKRKKSERVSWVPTLEDAPVRTSTRKLAVQNKEKTLASMKESETRRIKQMAVIEAANKKREAAKPAEKTQEERLAEAARVEKVNKKTLNKWEETEKDRVRKQKARLEALQNRKLEGPVIRWYSGQAEWTDGKLTHLGKSRKSVVEIVQDQSVQANVHVDSPALPDTLTTVNTEVDSVAPVENNLTTTNATPIAKGTSIMENNDQTEIQEPATGTSQVDQQTMNVSPDSAGFLEGIDHYAALPESEVPKLLVPTSFETPVNMSIPSNPTALPKHIQSEVSGTSPAPTDTSSQLLPSTPNSAHTPTPSIAPSITPSIAPITSTSEPHIEHSTRNLLTLINFDPVTTKSLDVQRRILFNSRPRNTKTSKPVQTLCAITSLPARYRDPKSGLAYANLNAYKTIQRLSDWRDDRKHVFKKGRPVWSELLGAWVGLDVRDEGGAARGVPEEFITGEKPPVVLQAADGVKAERVASPKGTTV